MVEEIELNGYKIKDNECTGLKVRIYDKTFKYFLWSEGGRSNDLSMNHIEIMKQLNNSKSYTFNTREDGEQLLRIETETHTLYVVIPEDSFYSPLLAFTKSPTKR